MNKYKITITKEYETLFDAWQGFCQIYISEYTVDHACENCPLSWSNNGTGEMCSALFKNYPDKLIELLKAKIINEVEEDE